jgi:hypothetical protein
MPYAANLEKLALVTTAEVSPPSNPSATGEEGARWPSKS